MAELLKFSLENLIKDKEDCRKKIGTRKALDSIHLASKSRILLTTDKLLGEEFSDHWCEKERPNEAPLPVQERWALRTGDNVRLKSEFNEYESLKSVQKRTVGWDKGVAKTMSQVGIITSICNELDCHVQVLFPENYFLAELYAGIVEKTEDEPGCTRASRFKRGDKVVINSSPELVALLQKGYDDLTIDMLNKVGEVIAVTTRGIFVTFEYTSSVRINSALLKITAGAIQYSSFLNAKGIMPGTKVRITANLKKFMRQTKEKTKEWQGWMSKLAGKVVTVLLIKNDELLRVCAQAGRSFDLHTSSLLLNGEVDDNEQDFPFKIDDWVVIKKTDHLKEMLKSKTIPLAISVVEYLALPARVISYSSDTECEISYNFVDVITVPTFVLEKASDEEAKLAQNILSKVQNLDVGSEVYLNLGPSNYVRSTLRENGYREESLNMVTASAKIKGFTSRNKVVIECSDGKLRKINMALLTLPENYTPGKVGLGSDLMHVKNIVDRVEKSIKHIQERFLENEIQMRVSPVLTYVSLQVGQPSTLRIDIKTLIFDYKVLQEALRHDPTWKFNELNDGEHISIVEINSIPVDMLVRFVFDADAGIERKLSGVQENLYEQTSENRLFITENSNSSDLKATPVQEIQQPEADAAGEEQRDQHMEWRIGDRRILVPFRESSNGFHHQEEDARQESTMGVLRRVSLEGNIRYAHFH